MKDASQLHIVVAKPNHINYSETFIDAQIKGLRGQVTTIYGGNFPMYAHNGQRIIRNVFEFGIYLFQKRVLGRLDISIRTKWLVKYFEKIKPDVVLAQYGVTGAMVKDACEKLNLPLVMHFHGFDAYDQRTLAAYKNHYKKAFQYASYVIAVSEEMKQRLVEMGSPVHKTVLINYGIDLNLFSPHLTDVEPPIFLSVARFAEKKAPHRTIEAFKKVLAVLPGSTLVMAGEGPLLKPSRELVHQLGMEDKVQFLEKQTPAQVASLMKGASVFVQHSVTAAFGDSEGTPNSLLEASASGLPIVSTKHAGIRQAVLDGVTGFLVDEHDVDAMAQYMINLANDSIMAKEMGLRGRQHIGVNYNQEAQLEKLSDVLFQAVKSKTGNNLWGL